MADFSDDDDRMLVRLAREQLRCGRYIDWKKVWLRMTYAGKSQKQLQIRLKTLKRTHGRDLSAFPRCFFGMGAQQSDTARPSGQHMGRSLSAAKGHLAASIPSACASELTIREDNISDNVRVLPKLDFLAGSAHQVEEDGSSTVDDRAIEQGNAVGQSARTYDDNQAMTLVGVIDLFEVASDSYEDNAVSEMDLLASPPDAHAQGDQSSSMAGLEGATTDGSLVEARNSALSPCGDQDLEFLDIIKVSPSRGVPTSARARYAHQVVGSLFQSVTRREMRGDRHSPDFHPGEVTPDGVSAMLAALPPMTAADTFVDIGSGIGNVVTQVALESSVGLCVGIEFQPHLADLSTTLVEAAARDYPRLSRVNVIKDDIRKLSLNSRATLARCTVLYSNNLVFEASSDEALHDMTVSMPSLQHVMVMQKLCTRHRSDCHREFCGTWKFQRAIPVAVSWSLKPHYSYWYTRLQI
jgi:hypothetical protein